MSPSLPPHARIETLKKQAKALLKAHRDGEKWVCHTLRRLPRLARATDEQILADRVGLQEAQHALAKEYGLRTWKDLKARIESDMGEPPVRHRDALSGAGASSPVRLRRTDGTVWLEPIPRFPWLVERVDDAGRVVATERERTVRILGNLAAAMRMLGHDVTWEQLAAAAGDSFRFCFEETWRQDAEYITHVDEFSTACRTLGIDCTFLTGEDLSTSLAAIDQAIHAGRPVLVGFGGRHWHVVVGIDRDANEYICIGGTWFQDWQPERVGPDETVSPHLTVDRCKRIPIPDADWHACVLSPEQVARNPLFIVGDRTPPPARETIVRSLQLAMDMNRTRTVERINIEHRAKAIEAGPEGHDGWKYFYSPWPGRFTLGTEGVRQWAATIAAMDGPTYDFEMIHGSDSTFGLQLRKMSDAAAWLDLSAGQIRGSAGHHLEAASALLRQAADVDLNMLVGQVVYSPARTREEVRRFIADNAALVYLLGDEQRRALGDEAAEARRCPWGHRLLPDPATFQAARRTAADALNRIADLRDKALAEIESALAEIG